MCDKAFDNTNMPKAYAVMQEQNHNQTQRSKCSPISKGVKTAVAMSL
jgi:hypothetical protein